MYKLVLIIYSFFYKLLSQAYKGNLQKQITLILTRKNVYKKIA